MEIYYINTKEYKPKKEIIEKYKTNEKKSCKKEEQHLIGRFLVDKIGEEKYGIKNREIEIINKKPRYKYSNIQFSISHSEDIILAAFDSNPIGADVEEMKERNFEEIFKRYNYKTEKITKEKFYEFWTEYEATIKLQGTFKTKISKKIEEKYILTVVGNFDENYSINKLNEENTISIY